MTVAQFMAGSGEATSSMDIQIRDAWDAVSALAEMYHRRAPDGRTSAYHSACLDALNGMPSGFRDVVAFTLICRSIHEVLDSGMTVAQFMAGSGEASEKVDAKCPSFK
jgi:L-aminopeptidase/D-esterase-like protein